MFLLNNKKNLKGLLFFALMIIFFNPCEAQYQTDSFNKVTAINKEVNRNHFFSLGIQTDGWGFAYEYHFGKTTKAKNILGIALTERWHPKEKKIDFQSSNNKSSTNFSVVYGKQNIAFPLLFYFGKMIELGKPNQEKGIKINLFYNGGCSIALMRPYYITLVDTSVSQSPDKNINMKYSLRDSLHFFNTNEYKDSPFGLGWNEMKIIPGVHLGAGIDFEFGHLFSESTLVGFRASSSIEYYLNNLDIMVPKANLINTNFFLNGKIAFYVGFQKTKSKFFKNK